MVAAEPFVIGLSFLHYSCVQHAAEVAAFQCGNCVPNQYQASKRGYFGRDDDSFSSRVIKMLKLASNSDTKMTSTPLGGLDKFFSLCHNLCKLLFDALY
jgi:hypothetical protein